MVQLGEAGRCQSSCEPTAMAYFCNPANENHKDGKKMETKSAEEFIRILSAGHADGIEFR